MKRGVYILGCALFLLASCVDKEETIDKKPICIPFSDDRQKFTWTDNQGQFIDPDNTVDENDWKVNESWNDCEETLFDSLNTVHSEAVSDTFTVYVHESYPNPCHESFMFAYLSGDSAGFKVVIVDSLFVPVIKYEGTTRIGSNVIAFNSSILIEGKYRMYYQFLGKNDSIIAKGHGDIVKLDY